MKKRLLSLLLVLIMAVQMIPMASAGSEIPPEDVPVGLTMQVRTHRDDAWNSDDINKVDVVDPTAQNFDFKATLDVEDIKDAIEDWHAYVLSLLHRIANGDSVYEASLVSDFEALGLDGVFTVVIDYPEGLTVPNEYTENSRAMVGFNAEANGLFEEISRVHDVTNHTLTIEVGVKDNKTAGDIYANREIYLSALDFTVSDVAAEDKNIYEVTGKMDGFVTFDSTGTIGGIDYSGKQVTFTTEKRRVKILKDADNEAIIDIPTGAIFSGILGQNVPKNEVPDVADTEISDGDQLPVYEVGSHNIVYALDIGDGDGNEQVFTDLSVFVPGGVVTLRPVFPTVTADLLEIQPNNLPVMNYTVPDRITDGVVAIGGSGYEAYMLASTLKKQIDKHTVIPADETHFIRVETNPIAEGILNFIDNAPANPEEQAYKDLEVPLYNRILSDNTIHDFTTLRIEYHSFTVEKVQTAYSIKTNRTNANIVDDASINVSSEMLDETNSAQEFVVKLDYDNLSEGDVYKIYRQHDGRSEKLYSLKSMPKLSTLRNTGSGDIKYYSKSYDGCYYIDEVNDEIHIFAAKFSVYAIVIANGEDDYRKEISVPSDYRISFNIDGDTETVAPIYATGTVKASDLPVPTKEGCLFDGWYTDSAMTTKVADTFNVNSDITLYGHWISSVLESEDHFAYIIGYPDGTIRPNNNITREEVTMIFYRLLRDEVRASIRSTANSFTDVANERWSNTAISTMANGNYIKGYTDGTFAPEQYITRAEFAAMASRFAMLDDAPDGYFNDISGHWAEQSILKAAKAGWINGYKDGGFKPDAYITRAEVMTLVNNILSRSVNDAGLHKDATIWSDIQANEWYYYIVEEATNSHNYTRQDDGINEVWTEMRQNKTWD